MKTEILVPNAILFVFDPSSEDLKVPEYKPNSIVSDNACCVSISTQADVDGPVEIELTTSLQSVDLEGLHRYGPFNIESPNRRLGCVTSQNEVVAEVTVSNQRIEIEVWTDSVESPARVVVVVR